MKSCPVANRFSLFVASGLLILAAPSSVRAAEEIGRDAASRISRAELDESLFVQRGPALFVNLARATTPDAWRQVPGVKGAWSKSGLKRGMTVLQDADGDGVLELYGEAVPDESGQSRFLCREADGTVRWQSPMDPSGPDNNGVHCEDLNGDGRREVVSVGNYLQLFDAATGRRTLRKFIFADFHGSPSAELRGDELRFDYPYRLAHCTSKDRLNVVVAGGYDPNKPHRLVRASDGRPDSPKGGIQIVAYEPDGTVAWHYRHAGTGYRGGGHEFRAFDLDGDGWDEIIHSANGGLVVLNRDGTERWRKDDLGEHSDWIPIVDVTGDGRLDIVVQQGGAKGYVYIFDALTGDEHSRTADLLLSQIQNLAAGRFRPERAGLQIALTTINGGVLRLLDGPTGELLPWPIGAAEQPTYRRWNGLDMYNATAVDADGDGVDEIITYSTPKGGQLLRVGKEEITADAAKAFDVGMAAFAGDGALRRYWNFYRPTESGVLWGIEQCDMRLFASPPRRFDVDGNGVAEIYLESEPWIVLVELADAR